MAGGACARGLSLGAATGELCAGRQNQAQGPREPPCSSTGLRHNPGGLRGRAGALGPIGLPGTPEGAALQSPAPDTRGSPLQRRWVCLDSTEARGWERQVGGAG